MTFTKEQKQRLFNEAYLGIIAQGVLGHRSGGGCAYTVVLSDGTKTHCAVGILIKNAGLIDTIPEMANPVGVGTLAGRIGLAEFEKPLLKALNVIGAGDDDDLEWLGEMQRCHDRAHNANDMKGFKERMKNFAAEQELSVPDPEDAAVSP